MVKKFMKKRSKRVKCAKRFKVEKKVREHHRKLKKAARKRGSTGSKKGPKDPGIPRILPFREKVVAEAIEAKAKVEENRKLEKERARELRKRAAAAASDNSLENLAKQASERSKNFELNAAKKAKMDGEPTVTKERPSSAYYHDLKKVIEKSDVLLEVIDARDPMGTRCSDIESRILSSGKRLILVMNKIDLVPRSVVQQWLRVLQSQLPAVAFKASTQTQRDNLSQKRGGHFRTVVDDTSKSSRCFGAESLLKLLGNYCRIKDVRTSITVGVIGLPNTGKSSLINSLKRSKVCNVGAHAGVTRSLQEVNLDKHIRLVDSPGVIFAKHLNQDDAVLRNCINPETVDDAVALIDVILKRCSPRCLMLAYNLPQFETSSELLAMMGQKWGKIKKGGVPDLNRTAKMVLRDWTSGKLGYYTEPPASLEPIVADGAAELVGRLADEFDINAISEEQFSALQEMINETSVPERSAANSAKLSSIGPVVLPENYFELAEADGDDDEIVKVDEQRLVAQRLKKARAKVAIDMDHDDDDDDEVDNGDDDDDDDDGSEVVEKDGSNKVAVNRNRKLAVKRDRKAARKQQNKADRLVSTQNSNNNNKGGDAYNFDECDVTMS